MIKKLLRTFFAWLFGSELEKLRESISTAKFVEKRYNEHLHQLTNILGNIDVSVDVHLTRDGYSRNWAVISIQGQQTDFLKFYDLAPNELREIEGFLRQFDRVRNIKIDAAPQFRNWIKAKHRY